MIFVKWESLIDPWSPDTNLAFITWSPSIPNFWALKIADSIEVLLEIFDSSSIYSSSGDCGEVKLFSPLVGSILKTGVFKLISWAWPLGPVALLFDSLPALLESNKPLCSLAYFVLIFAGGFKRS